MTGRRLGRTYASAAVAVAVALAGCGTGSAGGDSPDVAVQQQLRQDMAALASAAAARHIRAAEQALANLDTDAAAAHAAGKLDAAHLGRIRAAAARVQIDLAGLAGTPTSPAPVTATASTVPSASPADSASHRKSKPAEPPHKNPHHKPKPPGPPHKKPHGK